MYPQKRRRTATSVFAGDFDPRPQRDVLTSLLNGVPIYRAVEKEEEVKQLKRKERKEKARERNKTTEPLEVISPARSTSRAREKAPAASTTSATATPPPGAAIKRPVAAPRAVAASPFWQARRPNIIIPHLSRSVSVTPPPMVSSPPTTPGPSISSATSATSSKRPHTPGDFEDIADGRSVQSFSPQPQGEQPKAEPKPRKKRPAARKGWKGWVEGSPPPSQKLINLDSVVILGERKTRSGKSFDAIGVGKDSWV